MDTSSHPSFRLREVSNLLGVKEHTLLHWSRVIPTLVDHLSHVPMGKRRLYTEADVDKLKLARDFRASGLSLAAIDRELHSRFSNREQKDKDYVYPGELMDSLVDIRDALKRARPLP